MENIKGAASASGGSPDGSNRKNKCGQDEVMPSFLRSRSRSPLLGALKTLAAPFTGGRETHVTKASVEDDDLIDITPDQLLLPDFDITRIQLKPDPSSFSWGSFFKDLLSQKTLPVEDLTSFCGDYDYPANTEMLDRSWEDGYSMVKYELAFLRFEIEMHRQGLLHVRLPSRLLLRRLFYRQKVEKDVLDLKKRFGHMEELFQKLDASTAKGFEDLRQGFKELSLKNKQIIDEGLAAIEKASRKDQAAIDTAFDELRANLGSFEKEFANFVDNAEKASKSASSWLERLTWQKLLKYASIASTLVVNIANFIRDRKPEPSPVPPGPAPPCPSPVQEEQPVVEPPPCVPTTPAFYKNIGRQNKGLLHKDFALTPISYTSKMNLPFGPDNKSNLSVRLCTDNAQVACKVSSSSLFEEKLRMTFTAGLGGFKPKAKVFYAFPFSGVNGHLNASFVCGASSDLKLALTLEKNGLVAGGKILLDPVTKKLKHHEVGVSYGPGAFKLLDGDTVKFSLFDGGLSQVVSGGLELSYSRSKEEAAVCGAVSVKLGDNTSVKAKVDTTGAVTAAVRHRLAVDFEAGACVRVQLGKESRFGLSIRSMF